MKYSKPIHIIAARRSPIGRLGGALKSLNSAEIATQVASHGVASQLVPHIGVSILGQVLQAGAGMNVARQIALKLGVPKTIPAFTVNMICGSGLKAVALGADAIEQGEAGLALTGGVESMSQAPHYARGTREGKKLGDLRLEDAIFADGLTDPLLKRGMGDLAERLAVDFRISRKEQDEFALRSQRLAKEAIGAFKREIVPIRTGEGHFVEDEHVRADATLEKLQALKPAFHPEGTLTAGNSSGINDGAAMVLLAGEEALKRHGIISRARVVGAKAVGCDPAAFGLGPVGAIRGLCEETGWKLSDVDAFEINEAFAVQALACVRELGLDPEKVNQWGGAIALGHPIGCSGARVLVTLLHLLEDRKMRRGIASLCVGGGMGIAMAIERE